METRISAFEYLQKMKARDTQADDKNKIIKKAPPRILSLVELETEILALRHQYPGENFDSASCMHVLVQSEKLFYKTNGAWPMLQFNWPYDGKLETVKVRAYSRTLSNGPTTGVYTLDFRIHNQHLMSITNRGTYALHVAIPKLPRPVEWPLTAMHEIVDAFNMLLQARQISYGDLGSIISGVSDLSTIKYCGDDFTRLMTKYNKYNLTCRLNSSLVAYLPVTANTYQFNMNWLDKDNGKHHLKVSFVRGEKFSANYSRFLSESSLINLIPSYCEQQLKSGQLYYSLKIDEVVRQPDTWSSTNVRQENVSQLPLLSMWFTLDGLIGELRSVSRGEKLSGSDVLSIYKYFSDLLKIENMLICDDSVLDDPFAHVQIPLRVISAIATGKTWFEKALGVKLFDGTKLPVGQQDTVNQSSFKRNAALQELQGLPLSRWYDMLGKEQKRVLYCLHQYYWPRKQPSGLFHRGSNASEGNPSHFGKMTLKMLAEKIYRESKKAGKCTLELSKLNGLLCGTVGLGIHSLRWIANSPDEWVSSRVYQLMWGGYIWQQNGNSQESLPDVQRQLH